jgi:hypothetical protein
MASLELWAGCKSLYTKLLVLSSILLAWGWRFAWPGGGGGPKRVFKAGKKEKKMDRTSKLLEPSKGRLSRKAN